MNLDIDGVTDSIETLVAIARTIDFDILNSRQEAIAMFIVEARLLASPIPTMLTTRYRFFASLSGAENVRVTGRHR